MSGIVKTFAQGLRRSAALSVLLLAGSMAVANAGGKNAEITGNGFSATVLKVISENGTSWTKIEETDIGLPVAVHIGMDGFEVINYSVRQLGQPAGNYFVNAYPFADHVDYSTTYVGSTSIMTAAEKQSIISMCNSKLGEGKGIHESHNLFGAVGVELSAGFMGQEGVGTTINQNGVGLPHQSHANVTVPVKCEGKPDKADNVAAKEPNFGVKGIHLRFMTTAGYPTKPNAGTQCQMSAAKVRLETSKAGAVKFKLWSKVGNQPAQSQIVDAWSKFAGPGKFEASFSKTFKVEKSTPVQAMAEDLTNPIGQSTGWKEVTIDCTGAGGGGLASTPASSSPMGNSPPKPTASMDRPLMRPLVGPARPTIGQIRPMIDPVRPMPQRFLQAQASSPVAAKDRFYRGKPH